MTDTGPKRLTQATSPSRKEVYSVWLMLGDTNTATTARSPHFAATMPRHRSLTEQEGLPSLPFQNMATEAVRFPAPRDLWRMLYGSATAARPIRHSTRFWNMKSWARRVRFRLHCRSSCPPPLLPLT